MPRLARVETRTDDEIRIASPAMGPNAPVPFVPINVAQMGAVTRLGYGNPYTTSCVKMLMSNCFAGGMLVRRGETDVTKEMHAHFNDMWLPILQDAFLHLFMYGFCIVRRCGNGRPCALLNPLDYSAQVQHDYGEVSYRIIDHKRAMCAATTSNLNMKPLAHIFVFELRAPFSDGNLKSHFASVLESFEQLSVLNRSALYIWDRGAAPTVLTERKIADTDEVEQRRDYNSLGDQATALLRTREAHRDAAGLIDAQMQLQRATMHRPPPVASPGGIGLTPADTGSAAIVALPDNSTVSHVLPAGTPPDVPVFMQYVGTQMALLFGIPPMWELSARQASSNDAIDNMMFSAFRTATAILKSVAEVLISDASREQTLFDIVSSDDERPLEEQATNYRITVAFPGVITLDKISKLRDMGLLAHTELVNFVSEFMCIDKSRLSKEPYDAESGMLVSERQSHEETIRRDELEVRMAGKREAAPAAAPSKRSASSAPPKKRVRKSDADPAAK